MEKNKLTEECSICGAEMAPRPANYPYLAVEHCPDCDEIHNDRMQP
jgi:predicted RNA-binding Zn-ribbon protein involved in translation (DUF1610 family)